MLEAKFIKLRGFFGCDIKWHIDLTMRFKERTLHAQGCRDTPIHNIEIQKQPVLSFDGSGRLNPSGHLKSVFFLSKTQF